MDPSRETQRDRHRVTDIERQTQRDRQTEDIDRQTDRQTDRQRDYDLAVITM